MNIWRRLLVVSILSAFFLTIPGCEKEINTSELGRVTDQITDRQAITEVVDYYFSQTKNFSWKNYNMEHGLEVWLEDEKNEELSNPKKLPSLEKSIIDNQISRKLQETSISEIEINGDLAILTASTEVSSKSTNERFNGIIRSQETIELQKIDNKWYIKSHQAQNILSKNE